MRDRWQKLRDLGWLEWQVIISSLVLLPWCALLLRRFGFQHTRDVFLGQGSPTQMALGETQQFDLAKRIARAVNIAAVYGAYRANCLKRSLVLCRQLRRRGLKPELILGAAVENGDFFAHAWVETNGTIINDRNDVNDRFISFEKKRPLM